MPEPIEPTGRFSNRVREYDLHRPRYPEALFAKLSPNVLTPASVVADIGCGTGIFTSQIAGRVKRVHAVEPNAEMRGYASRILERHPNVAVSAGRAEETGLAENSVDVITAAQAFHWFDRGRTAEEFRRILRAGGSVLLVWYERRTSGDGFLEGYERLMLEHGTDYAQVDHRNVTPAVIAGFFHPDPVEQFTVAGEQAVDLAGLRGRVISSSYVPGPGQPGFPALMAALEVLFNRYSASERVIFRYDFKAYLCRMTPGVRGGSSRK